MFKDVHSAVPADGFVGQGERRRWRQFLVGVTTCREERGNERSQHQEILHSSLLEKVAAASTSGRTVHAQSAATSMVVLSPTCPAMPPIPESALASPEPRL